MPAEIERKFLVDEVPSADDLGRATSMRQGYLATEGDTVVRIRITDDAATLTVKGGQGVVRTEVEVDVPAAASEALWLLTDGRRINKARHRVELGDGLTAEIDVYGGPLDGLVTVEVEFPSEARARSFEPPAWFGRDVTDEPGWSNDALARHGRP